jgi:hypothetical protein
MPIGPKNIANIRHELIQRTCYEIDAMLQDPHKSKESVRGDSDDYFYSSIMPGVLSQLEKDELIGLYTFAGWERVIVQNSGEINQRPGLFIVKLYSKADSRHLRID